MFHFELLSVFIDRNYKQKGASTNHKSDKANYSIVWKSCLKEL